MASRAGARSRAPERSSAAAPRTVNPAGASTGRACAPRKRRSTGVSAASAPGGTSTDAAPRSTAPPAGPMTVASPPASLARAPTVILPSESSWIAKAREGEIGKLA